MPAVVVQALHCRNPCVLCCDSQHFSWQSTTTSSSIVIVVITATEEAAPYSLGYPLRADEPRHSVGIYDVTHGSVLNPDYRCRGWVTKARATETSLKIGLESVLLAQYVYKQSQDDANREP